MKKNVLSMIFGFGLTASVWGQELDLSFLKDLEAKAREVTNVSLGKEQMQLIQGLSGGAGGELKSLAGGIELVQVRSLEFDKEGMFSLADMTALRDKVKTNEFLPVISVKEKGGFTEILLRKGPKGNRGFLIFSVEPREVTIVNIVGDLDLASLGKLAGKFGIPSVILDGGSSSKGKGSSGAKKDEEDEDGGLL
jgi:hypothetical protein